MDEKLTMHKRVIEISGGREMYFYTFDIDGEPMPEMGDGDVEQVLSQAPAGNLSSAPEDSK